MLESAELLEEQLVLSELDEILFEVSEGLGRHVENHGDVFNLNSKRLLAVINNRRSHNSAP